MWRRTLTFLVVTLASAAAYARSDLSGCYGVEIVGANGAISHAPSIRLTSQSVAGPKANIGAKLVTPTTTSGKFSYPVVYWMVHSGEVVITFTYDAYDGVGMEMRVRPGAGGILHGVIQQYWDTGNVSNVRRVTLRKVKCGAT
jgi:hypothetical protein